MRWTVHIDGGPRHVNHAAVSIGDKIFSFGGYYSHKEFKDWEPIPVHVLHTTTLRWMIVNYKKLCHEVPVPFQRYGHTVIAYGHKVYMWGGRNNATASDTLSCFDTKTLTWTVPNVTGMLPLAKDGHSACVIKNKMYIFGGFEYLYDYYSQDIHCLDLDTMVWTFIRPHGTPPSHRDFHTAVAYNDRMYIYGGRGDVNSPYSTNEEIYCQEVYYFDTITATWVTVNAKGICPEGRRSHSAWIYDDYMYIFGGLNTKSKKHFNDLHRYSMKGNYWESLNAHGIGPCQRRRQACIYYKEKVYLFGGTSPCTERDYVTPFDEADNQEVLLDNSDLHVLDYCPTLKTLAILAVIECNLDQSTLPQDILHDIRVMTTPNRISRPFNKSG